MAISIHKRALVFFLAFAGANAQTCTDDATSTCTYTGHYPTWEDAPASAEEFDHDNDKSICRLPIISVAEWETGRYWEKEEPVIVKNVTDGWMALQHWTKEEMIRRYPDVMVGMGSSRDLGQTGPDDAGDALRKVSIKDFIVNHMHDADKYVFDRKLNMPDDLLKDCEPYPMPTRQYKEDYDAVMKLGLPEREMWKDHLALTIGRDLQGLTFHRHNAAWNVVVFGTKRWILYDGERFAQNITRLKRMTRDVDNPIQLTGANWIRQLYNKNERMEEIRTYGHDCIQRAGEMLYVPYGWAHMVVNIGDTVAIVSERGLDAMDA
eukprot:CCRYP_016394-RB/>CCRYP_016394-RB protein AED:0.43 eAED:0.43 QI:195/1/1/1/1/1/4/148/320